MSKRTFSKICTTVLAVYALLALGFYLIAGDQMRFRDTRTDMLTLTAPIGELTPETEIRQAFRADADEIRSVSVMLSTYARENSSHLRLCIVDPSGIVLGQMEVPASGIQDNAVAEFRFDTPVEIQRGQLYDLALSSEDAVSGNAITAWFGDSMPTAKSSVPVPIQEWEYVRVGGVPLAGKLGFQLELRSNGWLGQVYWYLVFAMGVALVIYGVYSANRLKCGKSTLLLRVISAFQRYSYLLRQLVSRDFKTKYKRSVLGVLWSFLNPLLTMLVQYIVFSTLFKSDIPNFALYLLIGIVCFNFFNEATSMSLLSIVGNAPLITKVYVPKYIYPVSRVLSSTINLLLSMIPLFAVMLLTGASIRPALLLLPFGLLCLVALCIGMGFILSTVMVFFRDTQFLWGVLSMLWMYATPIFYPESIIPEQFMMLYKCNPLYHIIRFIRIIMIGGVSPEPKAYVLCFVASFVPLLVGAIIFKKNQDKFVINL